MLGRVVILLCFVAHCLCISNVSIGISSFDKNKLIAGERITLSAYYTCDVPCGTTIQFTFNFGDGETLITTNSSISHVYSYEGWYSLSLSVQDSSTSSSSTSSIHVQPPLQCYSFQLFMLVEGEERSTLIVEQGKQIPIYARVFDPSNLSSSRSHQLTLLFDSVGELPSIIWDFTIPYSPSPYETPFQTHFSFLNKTTGVWEGLLTSVTQLNGYYPSFITLSGRLTSRGVGALGCSIRDFPFSATIARFPPSLPLAPPPTPENGAQMITSNYNPSFLKISGDPCSVNSGIALLGGTSSVSGIGGIILTSDDSFGPSTSIVDLIGSGEGPLCSAFPGADCTSIVIYDVKFVSGGYIVFLTSQGLAATYTNSSSGYNISSITTGVSSIDQGLSSGATMYTSSGCQQVDEMTGPNYVYITPSSSSFVIYAPFADEAKGAINPVSGSWVILDISNHTSSGRACIGAVWNSDSQVHTLLLSGSTSEPSIILSCALFSCDVTFTFPLGTILTSMTIHQSGYDLLVVGDSVWYSILGTTSFYKLTDLNPPGTLAVSVVTSDHHTGYALLSDSNHVIYGRIAVRDTVVVPSPLSQTSGPIVSNILFNSLGELFSVYIDTPSNPSSSSSFPIGLYQNSAGELRNISDSSVLHKTHLMVSGTVSSSDYSLSSSCPLSLLIQGDQAHIRSMATGCTLDNHVEHRVLHLTSGGSILLYTPTSNNTLVPGLVVDSLIPLTPSSSLSNSSFSFYPVAGSCSVSVVSSNPGLTSGDIGKTVVYRLDSVFLTSFTDSTHMMGTSLSCLSGFQSELSQYTSSSQSVILDGAGLFPFPDGPTSDGLGWLVPFDDWSIYDLSSPSQYRIVAECSYSFISLSQTIGVVSDAGHPVVYLDIGDWRTASAQISPPTVPLFTYLSNTLATGTQVVDTHTFVSSNGLLVNNITFSLTEGIQKGGMTLLLRPRVASLACYMANAALRVVHGCPPTKTVQFIRPYTFDEFLSESIPEYSMNGWPMLVDLPVNYRPPSPLGRAIPTANNIYHADPSKPRYMDTYRISKRSGRFKQCLGKSNREECQCTDEQRFSATVENSDCVDKVFAWSWREAFTPQFIIENNGEVIDVHADYTVTELNGRTDYCFNISDINCKSSDVENYVINGGDYIGIRFIGAELYHFRITVIRYYNNETITPLTSYCNLTTEIAIWAYNPPLSQSNAWLTVSLTSVVVVMLLFGAFLLYSNLYTSDSG